MKKLVLLVLAVSSVWFSAYALPVSRNAFQSTANVTRSVPPDVQVITLGDSVVALERGWKFHPGDSPWVDGSPLWAQPGYGDAGWAAMDLVPKAETEDPFLGTSGYIPGWTARGYPGLTGYAWYRLRVWVKHPGEKLWLKMPSDYEDAFQLYANGRYVGQFGGFSFRHAALYFSKPTAFALPKAGPDGILTLAVRFYMSPATVLNAPDTGGMHDPPALGLASTVQLMQASAWNTLLRGQFGHLAMLFLSLLTAPLALWAWLYNRRDRMWMWLFLALVWSLIKILTVDLAYLTTVVSVGSFRLLFAIVLPLWPMFWWHWFGLKEKRWIPRAAWGLAAASTLAGILAATPYLAWQIVPKAALPGCNDLSIGLDMGVNLLMIVILVEGFRRDRVEALLSAIPIALDLFSIADPYLLVTFHIPYEVFPFGFGITVAGVAYFLMITVIALLSLRRFMKTQVKASRERESIHRDLEQAQQLQQRVLVPEAVDSRHFRVETEYHPAQQVGGDFFQTVARADGSLLVVVGDVSGKGVSAAMLVAVLVGTIRNQAEHSFDSQEMLAVMNRRMVGRSGGHFATCVVAEIAPDGRMRIANAGHLQPYRNGEELELEGALPLGLTAEAEYGVQTLQLQAGDRLTFITDGVVEAQNEAKELFGFERARSISSQAAGEIARAASTFGQEDDITVVGVAFAGA
ncbi:MAG: PP2C family protein-serine/threonine phosphatase [Acidobacteriaceae bacterium]